MTQSRTKRTRASIEILLQKCLGHQEQQIPLKCLDQCTSWMLSWSSSRSLAVARTVWDPDLDAANKSTGATQMPHCPCDPQTPRSVLPPIVLHGVSAPAGFFNFGPAHTVTGMPQQQKNKLPKFHSDTWRFKTFSEGIVYIGNSIRVPPLPEAWKVRRVEITSVTTVPHHGEILRAFRSEKLTKIIKTSTRAWKMNCKSRLIWSYPLPRLASTSSHIAPRQSTLFDKPWCRPPKLQELGQDLRWNGSNFNLFECNQCRLRNKHLLVLKDGSRI